MNHLPYRLSLAALLLAITLPFLGTHHYFPIPTFYQEWLAGMLGLAALLPLAASGDERSWSIPRITLLPLAMIVLVWVQWLTGVDVRFENAVLLSLYLAWAVALMLATCRIESGLGRESLAAGLAWTLLAGALLLATTGMLQRWLPSIGMPYIFVGSGTLSGNVAQTNSFADYLWLGIASSLYLHAVGRLKRLTMWIALPLLIGPSLLSGSRSVYFYAVALSCWAALWAWQQAGEQRRRLKLAALLLLPVLLAMQFLLDHLGVAVSSAQRLVAQGSYDPVRLTLWRAALDIFAEHPLLGAGFDSFSRQFFLRIEQFPINGLGIPEHSHNLLTEFAAEFGIAGLGLLLFAGVGWLTALRLKDGNAPNQLMLGLLLILGIHSALEYPLWYAHFLAIGALCLAIGDGHRWKLPLIRRRRLLLAFAAICGLLALINLRLEYTLLEEAAQGRLQDGQALAADIQHDRLTATYIHSLWRPYAALQFSARMPLGQDGLKDRLRVVQDATHFSPIRQAVFKEAALLQLDGQTEAAHAQMRRAMLSYPADIPAALRMMEEKTELRPLLQPLIDTLRQRSF